MRLIFAVEPDHALPGDATEPARQKRKGATRIKGGLVARVRRLRGEAMLRHATLQTLDVEGPASNFGDLVKRGEPSR